MNTAAFWAILFTPLAFFGAPKANAGLQGVVSLGDSTFSGVEIEASSSAIDQFWETSTDDSGRYTLDKLPPGRYTVWAEVTGHGCIVKAGIIIKDGVPSIQNFHFSKNKRYPGCESLKPKKH